MYVPAHFKEENVQVLHDAIRRISFGSIVTYGDAGMEASDLPMLVEDKPAPFGTLHGHVARANPQWANTRSGAPALAIFLGPNAYISPSWYPTKQETGKVVPTWNYLSVHAYGEISFSDDRADLLNLVGALTEEHEASRTSPWAVADAPGDYVEKMLGAIIGFKLVISRLEGKWKMSQNRSDQDSAGVRKGLAQEDEHSAKAVAEIMATV
jgi:transcriptional regulator